MTAPERTSPPVAPRSGRRLGTPAALLALSLCSRLWLASRLDLSDGEALLWARAAVWRPNMAPPLPGALVRLGTLALGQSALGVRAPGILLSTAAAALLAGTVRDPVLVLSVLLTMPMMAVQGVFATPELALASSWAIGLAAAVRGRWFLASGAGIAAMLCLPRDGSPFAESGSPVTLGLDLMLWATPLILCCAAVIWWSGRRGAREDRLCWWSSVPWLLPAIWGWPALAAPAWPGVALALGRRQGRLPRAAWLGAGVAAMTSLAMLVQVWRPIADLEGDPRLLLAGGQTLAGSVAAWGSPLVLAEDRADAALLLFYGVPHVVPYEDVGSELREADRALYVRPFRGTVPMPLLSRGFDTDGPNDVTAYVETTDPTAPRLAARWQVFDVFRASNPDPGL